MNTKYEIVVGLEIHCELKTETKAFCRCKNQFGASINTNVCPVCMGLPGALPTINKTCVEYTIKSGLAFGSTTNSQAIFERKNYFYPDLSKSYQISQLEKPICVGGKVRYKLNGEEKFTRLNNIHMEEDAGKSIHDLKNNKSYVDFNRCGVPLIEIVTEPDIRSSEEAVATLSAIKETLTAIGVSDCKMQEGSLRCDVNLSIREKGSQKFGTRTEMKNLNSFKAVARAIEYEANRQIKMIENGETIHQITLKWDDATGTNEALRSKEASNDYRYFPDPDLVPIEIEDSYISKIKSTMPELPFDRKNRYEKELGLSEHDVGILTSSQTVINFFEDCLKIKNEPKIVANWVMTDLMKKLKENLEEDAPITISPQNFVDLINMFQNKEITINNARELLDRVWETNESVVALAEKLGLKQVNDEDFVKTAVLDVIAKNPQAVSDFKSGNERALTFFMGQVMKQTKGKANPQIVNKFLLEELKK